MLSGMTAAVLVVAMTGAVVPTTVPPPVNMRAAMAQAARASAATAPLPREALQAVPRPKRSVARIAIGAVLGGTAGFIAGGFVGFALESKITDGRCYDVCFRGLLIGAPVGAVAGAILGGRFF